MIPFESEKRHDSPLSPDVVSGFVLACNNIARYGVYSQMKHASFKKLSIVGGELQIEWIQDPRMGATHLDSGRIAAGHKDADGDMIKTRVWTPMEGMQPATSQLLGEDIQMATVCRDKYHDYGTDIVSHRDIVSTTAGRMFEIVRKINIADSPRPSRIIEAEEFTEDSDVVDLTDMLMASEVAFQKIHPEVAMRRLE